MSHKLLHIEQSLTNVPHLVHPATFNAIIKYLDSRKLDSFETSPSLESEIDGRYAYNEDAGVAVININGPLSYRPVTVMGFDCGGANYQTIKEDFAELVGQGAKTIALNIDSGGGEAYQCFATGRFMRDLADEHGVKIITFVDGMAASAAYALASIADEIIVAEGSEVGSIGVLVRLMNDSKALEKEGYERVFVTAGESKVPFAADGSFRPDFINDIQDKVDTLYQEFTEFVATNRNLSVEAIKSTEAKTFLPEKALSLGLIDKVMTVDAFYAYLSDIAEETREAGMLNKNKLFKLTKTKDTPSMELEELKASLESTQKLLADAELQNTSLNADYAALAAKIADKDAELAALTDKVAQLEKDKIDTKMSARLASLSAVVSQEKAAELNSSLESLSDEGFNTVLESLKAAKATAESGEMFTELGSNDTQDVVKAASNASAVLEQTKNQIRQRLLK